MLLNNNNNNKLSRKKKGKLWSEKFNLILKGNKKWKQGGKPKFHGERMSCSGQWWVKRMKRQTPQLVPISLIT